MGFGKVAGKWALVVLGSSVLPLGYGAAQDPLNMAQEDLVKRLGMQAKDVKLVTKKATTWTDGHLGLPKPNALATMALEPGFVAIFDAKGTRHLYTTGRNHFRYGGPVELWKRSLFARVPNPNDANLNGDLVRLSPVGTNQQTVVQGVGDFVVAGDGGVLFARRTSRSGQELYYLGAASRTPRLLSAAFGFGGFAVSEDGKRWAATLRKQVGGNWFLRQGEFRTGKATEVEAPDFSGQVRWISAEGIAVCQRKGDSVQWMSQRNGSWQPMAFIPESGDGPILLNKSESLDVQPSPDGKSVQILSVWFTGDKKVLVDIPSMEFGGFRYVDDKYVYVWSKPRNGSVEVALAQLGGAQKVLCRFEVETDGPIGISSKPVQFAAVLQPYLK